MKIAICLLVHILAYSDQTIAQNHHISAWFYQRYCQNQDKIKNEIHRQVCRKLLSKQIGVVLVKLKFIIYAKQTPNQTKIMRISILDQHKTY